MKLNKVIFAGFFAATAALAAIAVPKISRISTDAKPAPMESTDDCVSVSGLFQPFGQTTSTSGAYRNVKRKAVDIAALPEFWASVIWQSNWSSYRDAQFGVYRVALSDNMKFEKFFPLDGSLMSSCATPDFYAGIYYHNNGAAWDAKYDTYDLETGELLGSKPITDHELLATSLGYDHTTGKTFGLGYNPMTGKYCFVEYTFRTADFDRKKIADLDGAWNALAVDKAGTVYAINHNNGHLYKVDKTSGALTDVGFTGFIPKFQTSAIFDRKTNKLYWDVVPDNGVSFFTEVNTTTGNAETIYEFPLGQQLVGLFIPSDVYDAKVPSAASNLSVSYPEGTLQGTVNFDAPTQSFDGTSGSGQLTYTLNVNGEDVKQGTCSYSQKGVEIPYAFDNAGQYKISVRLSNQEGAGPWNRINSYIGCATPKAPEGVKASFNSNSRRMILSWNAVTAPTDGSKEGYFNADGVTYTVKDHNGKTLAENLTGTTTTFTNVSAAQLTDIHYNVHAVYGDRFSEAGVSNSVYLGTATPPYSNSFAKDNGGFTILDANGDGETWTYYNNPAAKTGGFQINNNDNLDMDDWLFSIPMRLEKGKMYLFKIHAWGPYGFEGQLEVKMGSNPNAASMNTTVIAKTRVEGINGRFESYISAPNNGTYYIGIHGCSDKDRGHYLAVNDFSVSEATDPAQPVAVSGLKAEADAQGKREVTLHFTMPEKTIGGSTLSGDNALVKAEIFRAPVTYGFQDQPEEGEKVLVGTINQPTAGQTLSHVDKVPITGTYAYYVTVSNATATSLAEKTIVSCGIYYPVATEWVKITEDPQTPGTAIVSWAKVEKDEKGHPLTDSDVTYRVCKYEGYRWIPIAEDAQGIAGTSYRFKFCETDEQTMASVAVIPTTEVGDGKRTNSSPVPVGKPYQTIHESFAGKDYHYVWTDNSFIGGTQWYIVPEGKYPNVEAFDHDGGYLGAYTSGLGQNSDFQSGKIDVSALDKPALSFYIYNPGNYPNELTVKLREFGKEWDSVLHGTFSALVNNETGWQKIIVPLDAYKGKVMQFALNVKCMDKDQVISFIDNIEVGNLPDHDLGAVAITAPESVRTGDFYDVKLTVRNEGSKSVKTTYDITLKANGETIKTIRGKALEPAATTTYTVECEMSPLNTESVKYEAVINYADDQNPDNNVFVPAEVNVDLCYLPRVDDLKSDGNRLYWSEPDPETTVPDPYTETFEEAEAFNFINPAVGDWTFYDGDEKYIGTISGLKMPNYTYQTRSSFFVFDNSETRYSPDFETISGSKFLASLRNADGSAGDNWAISPELFGGEQYISFCAKSMNYVDIEKVRIMYSTKSNAIEDFEEVGTIDEVPYQWVKVTFKVPEGTKYIALVSCSEDKLMLMVDDITFTPKEGKKTYRNIIGYDVWRDGQRITDLPVAENEYTDASASEGQHKYVVTVVYENGVSRPSNEVTTSTGGVASITNHDSLSILSDGHEIVVAGSGSAPVSVTTVDGKVMHSGRGDVRLSVAPGIYVVKAGSAAVKLNIR